MPLKRNLIGYGIEKKVHELLLDQTQIDYRDTLVEVAKEYPSTKQ